MVAYEIIVRSPRVTESLQCNMLGAGALSTYSCVMVGFSFFFFQAEDGIRYHCVTGVQTCALPISIIEAHASLISFGGSLVRDSRYRDILLENLTLRGHIFKHVAFIDDIPATGAVGDRKSVV